MRFKATALAFILIISLIFPSLYACSPDLTGPQTAVEFLSRIKSGNYKSAYKLVDASCERNEFIAMYTDFIDALSITDISYTMSSTVETNVYSEYGYTLTYHSDRYGDITDDYVITVKLNDKNRHYIPWTPALILPEMEYGDTIYKTSISASRGSIIADNAVLAEDKPTTTVSIVTENYEPEQIAENVKKVSEALGMTEEDVLYRLKTHVNVKTSKYVNSSSEAVFSIEESAKNAKTVCEILGKDYKKIEQSITSPTDKYVTVAEYMPYEITSEIEDALEEVKKVEGVSVVSYVYNGVALIKEYSPETFSDEAREKLADVKGVRITESTYSSQRYYPYGSLLAHIVGYTHEDENAEAASSARVGASGIEASYEDKLRGQDGMRVYLHSGTGQNKRTIYEESAENGFDVVLSVDMQLQQKAEDLLANTLYGDEMGGTVIVMNPRTGEIQAMASYPTYDLNKFSFGMTAEEYAALEELNAPFINRAVYAYTPGSIFKPVTAAAAVENRVLSYDYVFQGTIEKDHWKPVIQGVQLDIKRAEVIRRNSPLNMRNALVHSDNIYFANAALKLGEDRLEGYFNKLGLNEKIPFDVPVRQSQYKSTSPDDEAARTLQTFAETGYGQGTMLITPLQMACTYCAFANGGDIPTPYIVKGLYKEDGHDYVEVEKTTPSIWRENVIASDVCDRITAMLKDVVSTRYNGTGQKLRVGSYVIAGKTGTAEVIKNKKDNSWFIGYRTGVSEDEERLVLVMLEVPVGERYSELKLAIARNLLEKDDTID